MITTEETLPAPAGVEASHNATLQSFMETAELSPRLRSALREYVARFGNLGLDEIRPADIDRIRNAGPMTCAEFREKQHQYLHPACPA